MSVVDRHDTPVSLSFGVLARLLAVTARHHGLDVPAFSSPPRLRGASRTIRRMAGGGHMVAVVTRGRACEDVVADMVEGVIVANRLTGREAEGWRLALRGAVLAQEAVAA